MIAQAVATARAAGISGQILVRGDSAYGNSTVVAACRRAKARFSLVLTKNRAVAAAIAAIPDTAWTPVEVLTGGADSAVPIAVTPAGTRAPLPPGTRLTAGWRWATELDAAGQTP